MKNNHPSVSLIVLNYNGKHLLKQYFDSVFKQSLIPDEIIMLDNASTDDSIEYVKKHYPKVKIIKNTSNEGTAGGSNAGFRHATGTYVIFQSNDLRLEKKCIENLVMTLVRDKRIGICTSVYIQDREERKNKNLVDNAGGVVDQYGFGMQKYSDVPLKVIPGTEDVFFVYGSSFIIPHALYKKVGGFDERFFTLNDDIDLSWQVRNLGYRICYTKSSLVYHLGSATLGPLFERGLKRYWSERNALCTLLKNHTAGKLIAILPMYTVLMIAQMSFFLYKKRTDFFLSDVKAIAWNIRELPETLRRRGKIQKMRLKDVQLPFIKKSLKLKIFIDLYNYKMIDDII
jgi:GT2 family glycosyltransferase